MSNGGGSKNEGASFASVCFSCLIIVISYFTSCITIVLKEPLTEHFISQSITLPNAMVHV